MAKPLQPSTSTFRTLIEGNFLYVDKTRYIYELVREPAGIYFLSRPRRFGKSLFVSTLNEVFSGNKELFQGLWLYDSDYQWDTYSVLHLDFSANAISSDEEFKQVVEYEIQRIVRETGLTEPLLGFDYKSRFQDLIRLLAQSSPHKKIVLLIDEYDKPLIDNLDDLKVAEKIRKVLKAFYGVIKVIDPYLRFVFITGVSKFTRVSIFSELNHLTELTMAPSFSTALGLTEGEIRHYFAKYITDFAQQQGITDEALLGRIRYWYNGFCFVEDAENVYNPFSTLQLFHLRRFSNYWFKSGTPTFLVNLIHQRLYDVEQLNDLMLDEMAFDSYDIENLAIIPLLFQTGYLTIKGYDEETRQYTLNYPNHEVETAFIAHLLDKFSDLQQGFSSSYLWKIIRALENHAVDTFFELLQVLFANINYELYLKYEKYYQTIFYLTFKLIGLYIDAEVRTNDGRIDAVIRLKDRIYLFEFKLNSTAAKALKQINDKKYYRKYQLEGKPITLIGANFNTKKRTVDQWETKERKQKI